MLSPPTFGTQPLLIGVALQALLCESFLRRGELVSAANVTYLRANDAWSKLVLDAGTIHWGQLDDEPKAWSVPEEGWAYPHTDVAQEYGLVGLVITRVQVTSAPQGVRLELAFSNSRRFVLSNTNDRSAYFVA